MAIAYNPETERLKRLQFDYAVQQAMADWYRNFFIVAFVLAAGNLIWLTTGFSSVTPLYWVFNVLNVILSGFAGYGGSKWYMEAKRARKLRAQLDAQV